MGISPTLVQGLGSTKRLYRIPKDGANYGTGAESYGVSDQYGTHDYFQITANTQDAKEVNFYLNGNKMYYGPISRGIPEDLTVTQGGTMYTYVQCNGFALTDNDVLVMEVIS